MITRMFVVGGLVALMSWGAPAGALTFVVDTNADGVDAVPGNGICSTSPGLGQINTCSLRAAVMEINAQPSGGFHQIELAPQVYMLSIPGSPQEVTPDSSVGDLDITESIQFLCPSCGRGDQAVILANQEDRHFHIHNGLGLETVSFSDIIFSGGLAVSPAGNDEGLNGGSVAIEGGGASFLPLVTFDRVVFSSSEAQGSGAALYSETESLTIVDSLFVESVGDFAIDAFDLELRRTRIVENESAGLRVSGTDVALRNSIIAHNDEQGLFADGANLSGENLTIAHNTMTGFSNLGGDVVLLNSLLFANGDNCAFLGGVVEVGNSNITDDNTCIGLSPIDQVYAAFDQLAAVDEPGFGTYRLLSFSPAIDAGSNTASTCAPLGNGVDLLGEPRALDGDGDEIPECDVGAIEYTGEPDTGARLIGPDPLCDFPDPQAALAGPPGDRGERWLVMTGEYTNQAIEIVDRDVTITGGYDRCGLRGLILGQSTLRGNDLNPVIAFNQSVAGEQRNLMLNYLNLTEGRGALGGALSVVESSGAGRITVSVRNSVIDANAADSGGGVAIIGNVDADFENATVGAGETTGNQALFSGGGIYCTGGLAEGRARVVLRGGNPTAAVSYNTAQNGGGVYADVGCDVEVRDTVDFVGNVAGDSGGAFYTIGQLDFIATENGVNLVTNNFALQGGGFFATDPADLNLEGTSVLANEAQRGGAFYLEGRIGADLVGTNINGNQSTFEGGAFYLDGAFLGLNRSRMSGNDATAGAIGSLLAATTGSRVTLISSLAFNNGPANQAGLGSLFHLTADPQAKGLMNSQLTLIHSTLANNRELGTVFGSASGATVTLDLLGTIIWQPDQLTADFGENASVLITAACNNFSDDLIADSPMVDPLFVDPDGNDYQLASNSPMIDQCALALGESGNANIRDLASEPRPIDLPNVPNALGPFDIGAYEATSGPTLPLGEIVFQDSFEAE